MYTAAIGSPHSMSYLPRFESLVIGVLLASGCAQAPVARPAPPGSVPTAGQMVAPPVLTPRPPAEISPIDGHADHPSFNRAAYLREPQIYCAAVEPARCSAVAQTSPDVPLLAAIGGTGFVVAPQHAVTLSIQTDPGMPVSLTSFGLGTFQGSNVSAVTVRSDANGVAQAVFQVTDGTVGNCLITAGSPVRAGTVQFLIRVQP